MQNLRTYGKAPLTAAVIHGGPGAGGEMAPVARKLAYDYGVLEPIQTATTLEGQVQELVTTMPGSPNKALKVPAVTRSIISLAVRFAARAASRMTFTGPLSNKGVFIACLLSAR